ncbi:MAG: hypothetical protein R3C56_07345 [Pirellulaceae bacterium]
MPASGDLAVVGESLQVDVGGSRRVFDPAAALQADALGLGQQRTIFGDQAMATEDDVGGRFARPGTGVGVGRKAPARLAAN